MINDGNQVVGFAEKFSRMIWESGMTKKVVAEKLGVTPTAITAYTNGSRTPKAVIMYKIADLFHVPIDELLGIKENNVKIETDDIKPSTFTNIEHAKR